MLIRPDRLTTALLAALLAVALFAAPGLSLQPGIPGLTAVGPGDAASDPVKVTVESQKDAIIPGDTFAIAVILDHQPGWHTHTNNPKIPSAWKRTGFVAIPTRIQAAPVPGLTFGPIQWPEAHEISVDLVGSGFPRPYQVFEGRAIAYIPVIVAPDAAAGARDVEIKVSYQTCNDRMCLQETSTVQKVSLRVDPAADQAHSASDTMRAFDLSVFARMNDGMPPADAAPSESQAGPPEPVEFDFFGLHFSVNPAGPVGIVLIMLVGFLGGLILNLTPCVLPVIPIKIIGLQNSAAQHGGGKSRTVALGGSMFLGIVAFWLVIGVLIAGLRTVDTVNQIFGNRWFLFGVALFIGGMAAGMLGAFEIRLPQSVSGLSPTHDSVHGSFLFGVMTAILGIPCFGPFAGAVTAWATQQPVLIALAAFVAIGIGMALPYFVLALNPRWVAFIPRTGPASELVKQIMGLLLLATACFFLGSGLASVIHSKHYLAQVWYWWLIALICLIACVWLIARTFKITRSRVRRGVFTLVAIAIAAAPVLWSAALTRAAYDAFAFGSHWQPYSQKAEAEALAAGKVVVTDFTAAWCINCKWLEARVLSRKPAISALTAEDVVCLSADLTDDSAPGWEALKKLGERGIPVVSFQGPGTATPRKIYFGATGHDVVEAVSAARGSRTASTQSPP